MLDRDAALHPMQLLQSITPILAPSPVFDALPDDALDRIGPGAAGSAELLGEARRALGIAVKLPEVIATHFRREVAPTSTAQNSIARFLDWIDVGPGGAAQEALEVMQILQIEHGLNASTFAARVAASTLAPIENALSAGIGTLHGVLHGGADQAALEVADSVGGAENAKAFVRTLPRRRHQGYGHGAPRVQGGRPACRVRQGSRGQADARHLSRSNLRHARGHRHPLRGRHGPARQGAATPTSSSTKGLIFRTLGLPPRFFTSLFAMARVYGYIAHVLESRLHNRLIRPAANYVGD